MLLLLFNGCYNINPLDTKIIIFPINDSLKFSPNNKKFLYEHNSYNLILNHENSTYFILNKKFLF